MKNATLTVAFNAEKLDALVFHMGKKEADLQEELNDTVQRLYEKYVPQATREYIDDKVARDGGGKEASRRSARSSAHRVRTLRSEDPQAEKAEDHLMPV